MQKKIIALAIAAAFSTSAFADATVYGIVDIAVANFSMTDMKSNMQAIDGGLAGSRIGVVAAEDLDGGTKAIAKVEYKLDATVSGGIGDARQEMLALAGGFGTVAAGYLQTTGYDWQVKFDPTAGAAVDSLGNVNKNFLIGTVAIANRANRAVAYISPDMNGLTVAVNYSTNVLDSNNTAFGMSPSATSGTTSKHTAMLLSATYAAGPLAVGGVYASTASANDNYDKDADVALGASYDLGAAKLFATFQNHKVGTASNAIRTLTNKVGDTDTALSFSAVAPVGPGALVATVAKNNIKSTAADDNTTSITLAYLQGLSKTTTAYGALENVTTKGATDTKVTVVAVGVKKTF